MVNQNCGILKVFLVAACQAFEWTKSIDVHDWICAVGPTAAPKRMLLKNRGP